jgi:hypothetical protein
MRRVERLVGRRGFERSLGFGDGERRDVGNRRRASLDLAGGFGLRDRCDRAFELNLGRERGFYREIDRVRIAGCVRLCDRGRR